MNLEIRRGAAIRAPGRAACGALSAQQLGDVFRRPGAHRSKIERLETGKPQSRQHAPSKRHSLSIAPRLNGLCGCLAKRLV
jgi:hypothetical protein